MMKALSKKMIINDQNYLVRIFSNLIFMVCGVGVTIMPAIDLKEISFNSIFGTIFMLLLFGIPFGFFFGFKPLSRCLFQARSIKNNKFLILIDSVVHMRMLNHGTKSDMDDSYCQLMFEKHSKNTDLNMSVARKVYNETNVGDKFYIVYIGDMKTVVGIYPLKKYELDPCLNKLLQK